MVPKGFFGHILKGVMFLKWELVSQRNNIYHKAYVLIGVQQKFLESAPGMRLKLRKFFMDLDWVFLWI